MPAPLIVAVAPGSPAALAGLAPGDEVARLNGQVPRDVIEWKLLTDEPELELDVVRGGIELIVDVSKGDGEPLGVEVQSAVFDRVRTCDNHCEFCFIYQLPKGMRRSLYLKDDDYRLSFLYGNFTTLTRFTEADLERVVTERLSPLNVSIHATDPEIRSRMLRNPRGGMSLRWLRALLDNGIEVRGQIVVCPGVNDGRRARRHDGRDPRPLPRSGVGGSRPVGPVEVQHRAGDAAAHRRRGGGRRRRRRRLAGRLRDGARTTARACRRRVLLDGRPAVPSRRRRTTASRCTRTASAWRARSSSSSSARRRPPPGHGAGSSLPSTFPPTPLPTRACVPRRRGNGRRRGSG